MAKFTPKTHFPMARLICIMIWKNILSILLTLHLSCWYYIQQVTIAPIMHLATCINENCIQSMLSAYYVCWIYSNVPQNTFTTKANTMNPDQIAPEGAAWSGSIFLPKYISRQMSRHPLSLTLCIRETPKRVFLQTVKTQMKCRIIRHFIRVYTVCYGKKRLSDFLNYNLTTKICTMDNPKFILSN